MAAPIAEAASRSYVARLDLPKQGGKAVYISPNKSKDYAVQRFRVDGKLATRWKAERFGPKRVNLYRQGVVLKIRQQSDGRLKIVGVNTGPEHRRVGIRFRD